MRTHYVAIALVSLAALWLGSLQAPCAPLGHLGGWLGPIADAYAILVLTWGVSTYLRSREPVRIILESKTPEGTERLDISDLMQFTRGELSRSELLGRLGMLKLVDGQSRFDHDDLGVLKDINGIVNLRMPPVLRIKLKENRGHFDWDIIREKGGILVDNDLKPVVAAHGSP